MDHNDDLIEHLKTKVSRGQLLKAAAAGVALAAVPRAVAADTPGTGSAPAVSFPFFPTTTGTYSTETLSQIVQNLLTYEYYQTTLFVTLFAKAGSGLNDLERLMVQAAIAKGQYHIDLLQSLVPGIQPITTTFGVNLSRLPSTVGSSVLAALPAHLEEGPASLYITAAREFAELGQPTLVQYAAQISATYAEGEGIFGTLGALAGDAKDIPPNDVAFEPVRYLYTRDAINVLKQRGVIGGSGPQIAYPGRAAVLAAAGPMASRMTQQTPGSPPSS